MAIEISIKSENGVVLNYHRIAAVNVDVNQQVTVIVESYIDKAGRQYYKDYSNGLIVGEPTFPYTDMKYMPIPWDEAKSLLIGDLINNSYDWLKTQDGYSGAKDV